MNIAIMIYFSLFFSHAQAENFYYGACYIFDSKLEVVRTLPGGGLCLPLSDGGWLASDWEDPALRRYDKMGLVVWKIAGHFHHQMKLDADQELLLLNSEVEKGIRYDTIEKRSLQSGKLLKSFSILKNWEAYQALPGPFASFLSKLPVSQKLESKEAPLEFTHVNSIYIVPKNVRKLFSGAVYVINDTNRGICFGIDEDFKKIVWSMGTRYDENRGSHDCKILENGSILYIDNASNLDRKGTFHIRHIKGGKPLVIFPQKEADEFPGDNRGGVLKEPGGYVFSASFQDEKTQLGRITDKGQWIVRKTIYGSLQDIQLLPYADFMEKNQVK